RVERPRRAAWRRRGEWALGAFVALLLLACGLAFHKIRRASEKRRDIERRLEAAIASRLDGPLAVDSRPSEAQVWFDGQAVGVTPLKIPNPTFQRHSLRLQKEFFAPRDLVLEPARDGTRRFRILDPATGRELAVRDAEQGLSIDSVELVRQKGRVEIRTLGVEKAEVRIDGDLYGVTPFSRELDAGEHLFEIQKEGFKEEAFYEKIEGGAKVGRDIVLVPDGQAPVEAPAAHRLRIVSSPSEAVVFVNDEERGRTPCDLELPAGRHQLRLEKKFFEPHAVELTVEAPGSREYALTRVRAAVAFDSEPRGAAVYVDDRRVGVTPLTAEGIDAGSHKATFVLEGHYDQTATFEVVSRAPVDRPVKATLQRIPPGRLAVEADVRGAEVWIDGKPAGRLPLAPRVLESGSRRIRVLGAERTVTVEPGGEVRLSFTAKDLDLARVPEGEFKYGSSEARPGEIYARTEKTGAYWIDVHEVTNEQYAAFLKHIKETGDHGRCHPDEPKGVSHVPAFMNDPRYNGPRQPVVGITWFDAFAYAAWAGKRLPTEPEWEKAARGRTGWIYPWGNDWQVQERRCNASGKDDGFEFTAPVGACPGVSPYGCFDMVGNAREWCADDYVTRTGNRQSILGKVLRGGSFLAKEYNTTTMREYESPLHTSATVGFRCVVDDRK
ncbi:MAG TPA: SUMF1/EgtB/PvdO family nonheme iron enzyme, partial [Planctomycetota bacterium]|nr:SUMF1/EgtB/PvdO family nonheme iron enzyme [Planctomycetota bacterium]